MSSTWASFHLFRAEPWNEFLVSSVTPFIFQALTDGTIDHFFFIRYWEHGPHIRLRLKTTQQDALGTRVHEYFGRYFADHPSSRDSRADWRPNDSIEIATYLPELERYGGERCISAAEQEFEASSRAVLSAISQRGWCYERCLGTAVQLHMIFAYAIGFSPIDAARFYQETFESFVATSNGWLPPSLTAEDAQRLFQRSFDEQREVVVSSHAAIWSAVQDPDGFEQEWANRWRNDVMDVGARLRQALGLRPGQSLRPYEYILKSYFHMTNNRIGALNRDEAYLAFTLARGFETAIDGKH